MSADSESKWSYILQLDEELLIGGVIISEFSAFLVKQADIAFCNGADLAAILAAQAAIECHMRYENTSSKAQKTTFYQLIENSNFPKDIKDNLHRLRNYRNKWVHVNTPDDDVELLEKPEQYEQETVEYAVLAIKLMRQVLYFEQFL